MSFRVAGSIFISPCRTSGFVSLYLTASKFSSSLTGNANATIEALFVASSKLATGSQSALTNSNDPSPSTSTSHMRDDTFSPRKSSNSNVTIDYFFSREPSIVVDNYSGTLSIVEDKYGSKPDQKEDDNITILEDICCSPPPSKRTRLESQINTDSSLASQASRREDCVCVSAEDSSSEEHKSLINRVPVEMSTCHSPLLQSVCCSSLSVNDDVLASSQSFVQFPKMDKGPSKPTETAGERVDNWKIDNLSLDSIDPECLCECELCSVKVPVWVWQEHCDYHLALKLQEESQQCMPMTTSKSAKKGKVDKKKMHCLSLLELLKKK